MFIKQLMIAIALLMFSGVILAVDDIAGMIKSVSGNVHIERDNKQLPASVGAIIQAKDKIVTSADGRAGVTLSDDTLLSIGNNSVVVVEQFMFNSTTNEGNVILDIIQGSMRTITGLIAHISPSSFKVTTPSATIGIRGTDFIVEVPARD